MGASFHRFLYWVFKSHEESMSCFVLGEKIKKF